MKENATEPPQPFRLLSVPTIVPVLVRIPVIICVPAPAANLTTVPLYDKVRKLDQPQLVPENLVVPASLRHYPRACLRLYHHACFCPYHVPDFVPAPVPDFVPSSVLTLNLTPIVPRYDSQS